MFRGFWGRFEFLRILPDVFRVLNARASPMQPIEHKTVVCHGVGRAVLVLVAVLALGTAASTAHAQAIHFVPPTWEGVPSSIEPLQSFRLLLITRDDINGFAGNDINTYNRAVQNAVSGSTVLGEYSGNFRCLCSTRDVDAKDNTSTVSSPHNPDPPIYWYKGDLIANNYADFYSVPWLSHDPKDENGGSSNVHQWWHLPWTGTNSDGTKSIYPMGDPWSSGWVTEGNAKSAGNELNNDYGDINGGGALRALRDLHRAEHAQRAHRTEGGGRRPAGHAEVGGLRP